MSPRTLLIGLPGLLVAAGAWASPWAWTLENTARVEYYEADGPSSPYPFQETQSYDELSGQFSRRFSPYEQVNGDFSLLFNDSGYRSSYQGAVPERLRVQWEKGDAGIPFRLQAGDIYPFLSLRTLQRPLKGSMVEWQPTTTSGGRQSLLVFTGAGHDTWRDLDFSEDLYSGFSWLRETASHSSIALNFVQNNRDASALQPGRLQRLLSMNGSTTFVPWQGQKLNIEAEVAGSTGDYLEGATLRRDTAGMGWYGQLRGETGTPFSYRLRYENYGRDYHPNAASIPSDHQGYEAHAAWNLDGGRSLRGRFQYARDGAEAGNARDSRVAGLALSGPFRLGDLPVTLDFDAFLQNDLSSATQAQTRTQSARVNLGMPWDEWAGRIGLSATNIDDSQPAAAATNERYEVSVGATHRYELQGFKGSLSPALVLRRTTTHSTTSDAFGPSIGLQLTRNGHQIGCNGSLLYQDAEGSGAVSNFTGSLAANYRYSRGRHSYGLEVAYDHLDPDRTADTDSYKLVAFYTLRFDKPAGMTAEQAWAGTALQAAPQPAAPTPRLAGRKLADVMRTLSAQGIGGGLVMPGLVVFEARLLDELSERQRLALLHQDGVVEKTVLVIDFADLSNREAARQTYERARALMIARFGRPIRSLDVGDFTASFVQDINAGRLVRSEEWQTEAGYVRFGIPQRLDRQIRMELHSGGARIGPDETYWSVEQVP